MTDRTDSDSDNASTYYVVAFRESDGYYARWTFTLTPEGVWQLATKLRMQGILAFITQKGKVTYLRKPHGYSLKHKD